MIKAIGFDVGHTLIKYDNPLNWSSLYGEALKSCGIDVSDSMIDAATKVFMKYNTRIHPREIEVTSDVIFGEILDVWRMPNIDIIGLKSKFYSFFQTSAAPYDDAVSALSSLKRKGVKTGILTDVAYGMDDEYSLKDIAPLAEFIDIALTSVNVGYRKPHAAGYKMLLERFQVAPDEIMFVGDEQKDIVGANALGITSVLIDRAAKGEEFSQDYTIATLNDILLLIES